MLKTKANRTVKARAVKLNEKPKDQVVVKVEPPPKMIAITELIGKENICARVVDRTIPDGYDKFGKFIFYGARLESDNIWINSVADYGDNRNYVRYVSEMGDDRGRYVPDNFQVIVLEGAEKEKFLKFREEKQIAALDVNLHHGWMIRTTPEIFVEDEDGKCIPSFLFMPDKSKPAKTAGSSADYDRYPNGNHFGARGGCDMYWNGFQTEFNTQIQSCLGWQMDSIAAGIAGVHKAAKAKFPNSRLSIKSVMDIPHDVLTSAEDRHVELSSVAVLNVYGLKVNAPPARDIPFRSADGPIYFDMGALTEAQAIPIVKALDAVLGVACVSLFAQLDDPRRRTIRGLPGEYRNISSGLEYRTLSNAWLCHPMITNLVIDFSRKVAIFGQKGFGKYWNASEEDVISCLIECDVKKSHAIMDKNKEIMVKIFKAAYPWANTPAVQESLYSIFYDGAQTAVKDPTDFVSNWTLNGIWHTHSDGKNKNVARSYQELMASKEFKVA